MYSVESCEKGEFPHAKKTDYLRECRRGDSCDLGVGVLPTEEMNLAQGLVSPLTVEEVELIVEYGPYPSAL